MAEGLSFAVSAPGKVILFGEHSVVYGEAALATSINKRTTLRFKILNRDEEYVLVNFRNLDLRVRIPLPEINNAVEELSPKEKNVAIASVVLPEIHHIQKYVQLADNLIDKLENVSEFCFNQRVSLRCVLYLMYALFSTSPADCRKINACELDIVSQLQIGAGTGSSASFSVCLAAALYRYFEYTRNGNNDSHANFFCDDQFKGKVNEWAYACEQIIHGKASGVDNFVCTYGNVVEINGDSAAEGKELGGKKLTLLEKVAQLRLLIVDSGISRKTSEMVKKAADLRSRNTNVVDLVYKGMGAIARNASSILREIGELDLSSPAREEKLKQLYTNLEDLVTINQGLLWSLGVSHVALDEIVRITAQFGLKSKLTGAGGGGYVITIIPPYFPEELVCDCKEALTIARYTADDIVIGDTGLRFDLQSPENR